MNITVIIILTLLLVGLLIDWRKILAKLPKMPVKIKPRPAANKKKEIRELPKRASLGTTKPQIFDEPVAHADYTENAEQPTGEFSKEVTDMLAEADIHFRKGEYKAAEKFYLQAAVKEPRCSKAYSRLGVIYLENGEDWEDAESCFRQALKFDAENGYILNNLGLVLYHQDRFADAIRQFEMAVRQDELNASRHANLGMAYMAMRQYAKAESAFKRALKYSPNEMEYKDLLAEAMEKKLAHKAMVRR